MCCWWLTTNFIFDLMWQIQCDVTCKWNNIRRDVFSKDPLTGSSKIDMFNTAILNRDSAIVIGHCCSRQRKSWEALQRPAELTVYHWIQSYWKKSHVKSNFAILRCLGTFLNYPVTLANPVFHYTLHFCKLPS